MTNGPESATRCPLSDAYFEKKARLLLHTGIMCCFVGIIWCALETLFSPLVFRYSCCIVPWVIFLTLLLVMKQGPKSCPRGFIDSFFKLGTRLLYVSSVQKETFFHVFDRILPSSPWPEAPLMCSNDPMNKCPRG